MAKKYIEADALISDIKQMRNTPNGYSDTFDKSEVIGVIEEQPAADVRENVRGEWKHDKDDSLISGYCSNCGWESIIMETDVADMNFCPSCGADLRGEEHE